MAKFIGLGDARDGAPATSGTINSYASCTGSVNTTTVTTSLSVSAGDYILLHQTQGTGAGKWEMVKVASTGSGNFTADRNLTNTYTTGAQAVKVPQYTAGTISGTVTATAWNGTVGGIIALVCNGTLTISGSLNVNGNGYRGGAGGPGGTNNGQQGEGTVGVGTSAWPTCVSANGNGGGGGAWTSQPLNRGSGGGAGHAIAGTDSYQPNSPATTGLGGVVAGSTDLSIMVFGGGGGGGASDGISSGDTGGTGGGIIIIIAKAITISGSVVSNGSNATEGAGGNQSGSAAGGAGGSILIYSQTPTLGTNLITATRGTETSGTVSYAGVSSYGRIAIYYDASISGSSNPSSSNYNVDYDATLTTTAASNITAISASSGGNITQLGYNEEWATAYGICWNTTGTPTTADPKTDHGAKTSTGSFTSNLSGLTASTTYYIRSYVTTTYGTYYGSQQSFTTLSDTTTSSSTSTTSTSSSTSSTTSTSSSTSTTSTSSSTTSTSTTSTSTSTTTTSTSVEYLRLTVEEVK